MDDDWIMPKPDVPLISYSHSEDIFHAQYEGVDGNIHDVDFPKEMILNEDMKLRTPHPPIELFRANPQEFLMEFMFIQSSARLRDSDYEFWCLHWKPVTFEMLEICTEYISTKIVEIMNENAELERACKGLGPRRTNVLTEDVYEARTIELTRRPRDEREQPWDISDHRWCLCESIKLFPKVLAKNQRFKERLDLPVPGAAYDVIRGTVHNEVDNLYSRPEFSDVGRNAKPDTKVATPVSKVAGARRRVAGRKKAQKEEEAGASSTEADDEDSDSDLDVVDPSSPSNSRLHPVTPTSGGRKPTGRRAAIKEEHTSEEEYVPGKASSKKKAKFKAGASASAAGPSTPVRGRKLTRSTTKATDKPESSGGTFVAVNDGDDVLVFESDSDTDMDDNESGDLLGRRGRDERAVSAEHEYQSGYESSGSDESDKTITQEDYIRDSSLARDSSRP